jgi:hypothetical protein
MGVRTKCHPDFHLRRRRGDRSRFASLAAALP